ncbi:MAG: response regulator [Chlamydiae bacterium]|nr:response regulator [Chlamydiota bacterium]MBI3278045.1 response regulator [Chlamydiota bacterium]
MIDNRPILLAEDDQIDQKSVKRAFNDVKIVNSLVIVENGQEALHYLKDSCKEYPCLILLDLNMPVMNGIEFLHVIKADDELKIIPVVVLTTSKEDQDRVESYKLSVAGYMLKPVNYQDFVEVIRAIDLYWTLSAPHPLRRNIK